MDDASRRGPPPSFALIVPSTPPVADKQTVFARPKHPSLLRQTSSRSSPDPLSSPAATVISTPATRPVYVPRSIPPPQLAAGPSTASPSYGLERIVARVDDEEANKWYYRIEQRKRRFTTPPEGFQTDDAWRESPYNAVSRAFERSSFSHRQSSTRSSVDAASTDTETSSSTSAETQGPYTYSLISPEKVLEHVSAAELEAFESHYVRQQMFDEEQARLKQQKKKQRALEARRELAVAARVQNLAIDMHHTEPAVESEASPEHEEQQATSPIASIEGGRKKRKAGKEAADRLAATTWTRRGAVPFPTRGLSSSASVSSSKRPGRPKGSGQGKPKALSRLEAKRATPPPSATDEDIAEPELHMFRIVRDRWTRKKPRVREFEIEWAGLPGQNVWKRENELSPSLIEEYDRDYEVEDILKDWMEDGVRMFEVSWQGYPGENTQQDASTLSEELVAEYLERKYGGDAMQDVS